MQISKNVSEILLILSKHVKLVTLISLRTINAFAETYIPFRLLQENHHF